MNSGKELEGGLPPSLIVVQEFSLKIANDSLSTTVDGVEPIT